ncbi:hypothetical protein ACSS6W_009664 [Trichoderma asperelloides]
MLGRHQVGGCAEKLELGSHSGRGCSSCHRQGKGFPKYEPSGMTGYAIAAQAQSSCLDRAEAKMHSGVMYQELK